MSTNGHSSWSASGFEQRMLCPGSHVLQRDAERTSTVYSAEGTAAHLLLTWALEQGVSASAYLGRIIEADGFEFEVDEDMARHVQVTIDYVNDVAGETGVVLVDRKVDYSTYLDLEPGTAWGTLDVAVLLPDEIVVIDLKYGMGVEVRAGYDLADEDNVVTTPRPNPQLAMYGLGALAEFADLGDFQRVRLVISQPRISVKPSEYDMMTSSLEAWGRTTARSAVNTCRNALDTYAAYDYSSHNRSAWERTFLSPGEKQCRFCKAAATCPALRDEVAFAVTSEPAPASPEEFGELVPDMSADLAPADEAWLAAALSKVDVIEAWCTAVRAEVERRLLAGNQVPGYKLVAGKRGARQWSDKAAAEKLLRETFRLPIEKAYDLKLISPTTAEKLSKAGDIGPRQWPRVIELITQPQGKPHVAPVSDSRPALVVTAVVEDFNDVTADLA